MKPGMVSGRQSRDKPSHSYCALVPAPRLFLPPRRLGRTPPVRGLPIAKSGAGRGTQTNIVTDIGERSDIATQATKKRDELLDDLPAWFKKTDAKLPAKP